MKTLVSALFLMALVSCNGSGSSDSETSKKCTFNEVPVDCNSLTSGRATSGRPSEERSKPVSLKASVSSAIEVSGGAITILENHDDVDARTENGSDYTCEISTRADTVIQYKVEGNTLTLTQDGDVLVLKREGSAARGLDGKWVSREADEMGYDVTTMVFSGNKLIYSNECIFQE